MRNQYYFIPMIGFILALENPCKRNMMPVQSVDEKEGGTV